MTISKKKKKEVKKMKKSLSGLIIFIVGILVLSGCAQQEEKYTGPVEKISISISATSLLPALVHIAKEKGYFLEEGIDVEIKGYSAGRFAFQAMLDGEADIATVSDQNIVTKSFERNDFRVFGTIVDSADHTKALARKSSGIKTAQDIVGKRVATTIGTTAYFFMVNFFIFNGLDLGDVELVDLKPGEMVDAIEDGSVDVIFTWEPNIIKSVERIGDDGIIFAEDVGYSATFSLASQEGLLREKPDVIRRLMIGLINAEEFVKLNREESMEIVASSLGKEKEDIEVLWDNYNFELSLRQSFLITLEDEARWAIANELTDATKVPNYLNYIYLDALDEAKPGAVTIIR